MKKMYDRYGPADWKAGFERSSVVVEKIKAILGERLLSIESLGKGNDTTERLTDAERAASAKSEADWLIRYTNKAGAPVVQMLEVSGSDWVKGESDIWVAWHKVVKAAQTFREDGLDTVFALVYPKLGKILVTSYTRSRELLENPALVRKISMKDGVETYVVMSQASFKPIPLH